MKLQSSANLQAVGLYVTVASFISMGIGFAVIIFGWYLNIPLLRSILSNAATMKFNTALCFFCSGLALWLLREASNSPRMICIGRSFAGVAILIGLLSLIEYAFSWDLRIDQLFVRDLATAPSAFPGRMSIITALCFCLCGSALLWIGSRRSQYLSIGTLLFSLLSVTGYMFDYQALYRLPGFGTIAPHTAWTFFLLSLAILLARPSQGIMQEVMSELEGGRAIRVLMPSTILIMILLGKLIVTGERLGLYIEVDNMVILIVSLVFLYSPLIYLYARRINQAQSHVNRLNRLYTTLSHINQSIVHARDQETLYTSICEAVIDFGKFRLAWVGLLDDSTGNVSPAVARGIGAELIQPAVINIRQAPYDQGLMARALQSGQISTSNDVQSDENMAVFKEYSQEIGFRSVAAIPFRLAGKTIGALVLFAAEVGLFDLEQERQLLREVGNDISFALDTMVAERSKAHLAAIVESSVDAIVTKDLDGVITSWNQGAEQIFGYSAAEIVGQSIRQIVPPDREAEEQHILDQIRQDRYVEHFETVRRNKDGQLIDVSLSISPIRDADNKVIGASKIARDISARKQSEAKIDLQAQLLAQARDAIIVSDENYRIIFWNPAAELLYGWQADEVLGRRGVDILKTEFPGADAEQMRQNILETGAWLGQVTQARRNGTRFPCEVSATVLHDENGRVTGYISVNRDITEHKQLQERFRLAIEAATSAIIMVDQSGKIVLVNSRTENYFGYTRAELFGMTVDELVPESLRTRHGSFRADYFRAHLLRPMGAGRELHGLHKDGTQFPVEIGLAPVESSTGLFVLATIVDITERRQSEQALRESEERFSKLFQSSPVAANLTSLKDSVFIDVNESFLKLFGYSREELIGHTAFELNFFPDVERVAMMREQVRERGNVNNFDIQVRTKSGENRSVIFSTERIQIKNEAHQITTIVDVTERKRAETELQIAMQELQHSNRELEQFAYVASHDLQEPLRTIIGMVQLLQRKYKDNLDARAEQYIDFTVEAATHMQSLINDLLDYSRLGRRGLPLGEVNLNEILDLALNGLNTLIETNQAVITYDRLPTVTAERSQMIRLFQNLISNAIKFRGKHIPEIHIAARAVDARWEFSVRDNGIGIEPQYFERIFSIFQRLHTRAEYSGTGIGLSICKKIVENHGGRMWVESEPGNGSVFYFTLASKEW